MKQSISWQEEWLPFAYALYQKRRNLRFVDHPENLSARITVRDGIQISDKMHHLRIGQGFVQLDGNPVSTSQEQKKAISLLKKFMEQVEQVSDPLSMIKFSLQHDDMTQSLSHKQLSSMRSAHRQFSEVGSRQKLVHQELKQVPWFRPLLTSISKEKTIYSHRLSYHHALLIRNAAFSNLYHTMIEVLSLPEYGSKKYVWWWDNSQKEFLCVARCQRIIPERTDPSFFYLHDLEVGYGRQCDLYSFGEGGVLQAKLENKEFSPAAMKIFVSSIINKQQLKINANHVLYHYKF